jgi:hypothetical protein
LERGHQGAPAVCFYEGGNFSERKGNMLANRNVRRYEGGAVGKISIFFDKNVFLF